MFMENHDLNGCAFGLGYTPDIRIRKAWSLLQLKINDPQQSSKLCCSISQCKLNCFLGTIQRIKVFVDGVTTNAHRSSIGKEISIEKNNTRALQLVNEDLGDRPAIARRTGRCPSSDVEGGCSAAAPNMRKKENDEKEDKSPSAEEKDEVLAENTLELAGGAEMSLNGAAVPLEDDGGSSFDEDDEFSDSSEGAEEDSGSKSDEEIDPDYVDELLEQGLPESKRISKRKQTSNKDGGDGAGQDIEYNERELIVLDEKGKNTFEQLPGGWIEVRHCSGMPLYLNRPSRVCTVSKPYFLGPGSVRKHSVPLSAIPCLAYRRALDNESSADNLPAGDNGDSEVSPGAEHSSEEKLIKTEAGQSAVSLLKCPFAAESSLGKRKHEEPEDGEIDSEPEHKKANLEQGNDDTLNDSTKDDEGTETTKISSDSISNGDAVGNSIPPNLPAGSALPQAKVASAKESHLLNSVGYMELRSYCERLFQFKKVKCKRFKTWRARRKHTKLQKRQQLERPALPESVKLITFPVPNGTGSTESGKGGSKEYIMNPQGKSHVCILHEYVQHALRKQPVYDYKEIESAATPYEATVVINGMQYGCGLGSSKKAAKSQAAKNTLEILIPQMKEQLDGTKKADSNDEYNIMDYFERFSFDDIAITQACKSLSEPPPYALLLNCLQRNFGQGTTDSNVEFKMVSTGNQSNKFRMAVAEHVVEVNAPNKKDGKQLASQLMLQKLHPNIINFGAFIKMFGNSSIKSVKEKKQEEQQITTLQSKASANSPNWAILSKLQEEMRKLAGQTEKTSNRFSYKSTLQSVTSNSKTEDPPAKASEEACPRSSLSKLDEPTSTPTTPATDQNALVSNGKKEV